jgi:hypothetical protein
MVNHPFVPLLHFEGRVATRANNNNLGSQGQDLCIPITGTLRPPQLLANEGDGRRERDALLNGYLGKKQINTKGHT